MHACFVLGLRNQYCVIQLPQSCMYSTHAEKPAGGAVQISMSNMSGSFTVYLDLQALQKI